MAKGVTIQKGHERARCLAWLEHLKQQGVSPPDYWVQERWLREGIESGQWPEEQGDAQPGASQEERDE